MNKIRHLSLKTVFIGLILLSSMSALASNFVCGQDLNGDGVLNNQNETASCSEIESEQFCSIGAVSCNSNQSFKCSVSQAEFDTRDSCTTSCQIPSLESGDEIWTRGSNSWDTSHRGQSIILVRNNGWWSPWFTGNQSLFNGVIYKKGTQIQDFGVNNKGTAKYKVEIVSTQNDVCTTSGSATFSCPVEGNSCVNNNGIQQCSPNKCVDLEVTPPVETTPPSVTQIDNGDRNAQGACMEQPLLFTGRNLSCKKSGFTKDCCKDTGVVYNDSSGSILGSTAKSTAISQTYLAVSKAYSAYTAVGGSVAAASSAAQTAFVGVDPYSIAISIAIQVITKMISCGQQDTEAAMLNGSGYCHLVGTYCSKKWPLVGCVVKSESHCCFNSKLGRIIQQQGREQMGMDWGSPESPSCGGFTPDQFQSLDFSRIDMSEYYGDIKSKSSSLIQKNITKGVEDYYRQIRP